MEAVVTTATKIATATPAAMEGAAAVANVANAATTGAEMLQTVSTATEAVQKGVKAVEVGAEVADVVATPEAMQVANNIETTLAQGAAAPEQAMKDLVNLPVTDAETAVQVVEGEGVVITEDATLIAQRQEEILRAVQPQMAEWEKSNPPGNDIQEWIERRAAAERQFTVNEGVERDLAEWKNNEENLPPDKDQHPEEYAAWEKRLAGKEMESRRSNEASYDHLLKEQEQKKQEMSREEFMRKYAELLQLRAVADNLAVRLQKLRMSPHQTPRRTEVLSRAEAQLETMRADIATREADLQFDAISSGSIWKQIVIPAAVGAAVAAGPVAEAANEV